MKKYLFFLVIISLQSRLGATRFVYSQNAIPAIANPSGVYITAKNASENRPLKRFEKTMRLSQMRPYDPKKRKGWLIVEIVLLSFATAFSSMLTAAAYAFSSTPGVPMMIDGGVIAFGILALLFLTTLVFCIIQLRKVIKTLKKQTETTQ